MLDCTFSFPMIPAPRFYRYYSVVDSTVAGTTVAFERHPTPLKNELVVFFWLLTHLPTPRNQTRDNGRSEFSLSHCILSETVLVLPEQCTNGETAEVTQIAVLDDAKIRLKNREPSPRLSLL